MKGIFCFIVLAVLFVAPASAGDEGELLGEISFLNLLNGLYLTEGQLEGLVSLSRRADELRDAMLRQRGEDEKERLESFKNLREELVHGADVPEDVSQEAVRRHHARRRLRDMFKMQLSGLAGEAESVFTEGQKEIIEGFTPCFTPPRDLKSPERAGQAESSGAVEKVLSLMRKAPPGRAERIKARIIERHIERFSLRGGPYSDEEIDVERRRVSALIDSAMDAPEVDFEMKKEEFARQFKPREDAPSPSLRRKVAKFFLGDGAAGVLEDKLAAMRLDETAAAIDRHPCLAEK